MKVQNERPTLCHTAPKNMTFDGMCTSGLVSVIDWLCKDTSTCGMSSAESCTYTSGHSCYSPDLEFYRNNHNSSNCEIWHYIYRWKAGIKADMMVFQLPHYLIILFNEKIN